MSRSPAACLQLATKRSEDGDLTELMMMDHDGPPDFTQSPAQLMPPPRGLSQYSSPLPTHTFQSPGWGYEFSPPNEFTTGFSMNSPVGPSPPRSDNSPMTIVNILCPSGPGVFTPPQYDTRKPENVMPEAAMLDLKPPAPPQPTRTPPPLPFNPPMWAEIPMNPSDESSSEDETEEIPQYDGFELVHSPKRRRLNSSLSHDVYHFGLPPEELRMWDFYTNVTCKILSCKNAAGENPWRDALIGRAVESDSLKHALFALTRFHMKRHMQDKEQLQQDKASNMSNLGLQHTNASFQALRREINQGLGGGENNIAAMLVLSFSQVLALIVQILSVGLGRPIARRP
jgi:hypothetical protein